MLHILNSKNTILNKFIGELRDKRVQTDSMRFRRNLERIAEISAYEISKELNYRSRIVETPLGEASVESIDDTIVIATILRAGLPFPPRFSQLLRRCPERLRIGLPQEQGRRLLYRQGRVYLVRLVGGQDAPAGRSHACHRQLPHPRLRGSDPARRRTRPHPFRLRHSQRTGCRLRSSTHLRAEVHPLVCRRRRGS